MTAEPFTGETALTLMELETWAVTFITWDSKADTATIPNSGDTTINRMEGALYLQVPLDETATEREQFIAELGDRLGSDLLRNYVLRDLYEKYIDIVGANGLISSMNTVRPACHFEGHDLGKVIYSKLGNVGTALRTCQDTCYSGCMHGVLMEHLTLEEEGQSGVRRHVSLEDVEKQIGNICNDPDMSDMYRIADCVHGIGHALMYLSNYDIPKAIEYCELFESDPLDYYCATGAYMEYVETHDEEDSQSESLFYPCDQNSYPAACFRYKVYYVAYRHYTQRRPLGDIINACKALEGKYRLGCFHGIGNAHVVYVLNSSIALGVVCGSGTQNDRYMCIEGAIERLAKFYPVKAQRICDSLSGWQKDVCSAGASRQWFSLDKSFHLYLLKE